MTKYYITIGLFSYELNIENSIAGNKINVNILRGLGFTLIDCTNEYRKLN